MANVLFSFDENMWMPFLCEWNHLHYVHQSICVWPCEDRNPITFSGTLDFLLSLGEGNLCDQLTHVLFGLLWGLYVHLCGKQETSRRKKSEAGHVLAWFLLCEILISVYCILQWRLPSLQRNLTLGDSTCSLAPVFL